MATLSTPGVSLSAIILAGGDMSRNKGEQLGWAAKAANGKWKFFFRQYLSVDGKFEWRATSRVIEEAKSKTACLKIGRATCLTATNAPAACAMGAASFKQFYEIEFKPLRLPFLGADSAKNFDWVINKYCLPQLGELRMDSPQWPMLLQAVINGYLEREDPLSVQSVTHIRNKVSAVFTWAAKKQKYIGINPAKCVDLPKMTRKRRVVLTLEQVLMLQANINAKTTAATDEYRLLVIFQVITGLRINEALSLTWADVNLSGSAIDSPIPGIALASETLIVWKSKTEAGIRAVPLIDALVARLAKYREASKFSADSDLVFPNTRGKKLDAHNVGNRHVRDTARKLQMGVVGWHSLRHSAATLAEKVGVSPAMRQQILGHSSPRMTLLYTHGDAESVREKFKGLTIQ